MRFGLFEIGQQVAGKPIAEVYDELLRQMVLAEELGFESVFFAEHHFSDYSVIPSPNLLIAALSQRTRRIRIGTLVNVLPFHNPVRLAEEVAMLDVLSGGRFEFGIGRGVQRHEFKGMSVPMAESRERFQEAIEVILLALTRDTFSYDGRYHQLEGISLSVKPIQKPHPPVWVTALSPSSIDWSADRSYPIVQVFVGVDEVQRSRERYESAWKRAGNTGAMPPIGISRHVYVAETTERARRESRAFLEFWTRLRKIAVPEPGVTHDSIPGYEWYENRKFGVRSDATFEQLIERDILIAGDPTYCAERVHAHEEAGAGFFVAQMSFGGLEPALLRRSMELFGTKVMPRFAAEDSRR